MTKFNNPGLYKALLLAGSAGVISIASPAFAQASNAGPSNNTGQGADCAANPQDARCIGTTETPAPTASTGTIVVTGSRIARQDYNSNSPMVSADSALLQQSSTAAIEQNLNKLPEFVPSKTPTGVNAGDIQPTATNTPGSANISLRGLGPNRNLVLIDGRRATPGNATGVVDINTIPSAAIERVEIITGGASSTYGADAIAGVANFILKKNFQGFELDGQMGINQEGKGFEYQVSGIVGSDLADGRGNVSLAMSFNDRAAVYQRDLPWFRQNWANPNLGGAGFFPPYPGVSIGGASQAAINAAFPQANPPVSASFGPTAYVGPNGIFTGTGYFQRGGAYSYGPVDNFIAKKTATGQLAFNDTFLFEQLPLTRYNILARGNYEINDWIGVFGQAMYSHVHTHTVQEGGPIVGGWSVGVPYGAGTYTGQNQYGLSEPSSVLANGNTNPDFLSTAQGGTGRFGLTACPTVGGCSSNTVFPITPALQTLLASGAAPNGYATINYLFPFPRANDSDVDTFNMTAGLEGKVPGTDWTWETFVNHGQSSTYALQTGVLSLNRLRALFSSPNFGRNFSAQSNAPGFGFGANFASCTSGYNIFSPPAGGFSQNCQKAITADLQNRATISQTIWEANITGSVFQLPAGALKAAIGASYRTTNFHFNNDTITSQGESFQDQALGIYPSGNTQGKINVRELYGELLIPVLKDTIVQEFNLELGGRISKYSTTGTSYTYKALGDLAVTDWLRFRGGYNRAERAPNIAELYLAPQQTFAVNALGDICSQRATYRVSAGVGTPYAADVQAVCTAVMNRTAGPGSGAAYYATPVANQPAAGAGFAFPTLQGNALLKPERADTWTAGVVIRSPWKSNPWLSRLMLSVDWFNIKITNAIGFSPGIALQECFDPTINPLVSGSAGSPSQAAAAAAAIQCGGVAYQPGPVPGSAPGLGNILMSYTNGGKIDISGIDAQLDWSAPVGPGRLSLNVVGSYFLHYRVSDLASNPLVDYVGTFGTTNAGLSGAAYRWQTLTTLGYSVGPAYLSLQWQHKPSIEDSSEALFHTTTLGAPAYDLFNLNASYSLTKDITIHAGVDDLFNHISPLTNVNPAANPAVGQLPGGGFNSGYYDTLGRRFSFGANLRF